MRAVLVPVALLLAACAAPGGPSDADVLATVPLAAAGASHGPTADGRGVVVLALESAAASMVGAFTPGRVRVTLELAVANGGERPWRGALLVPVIYRADTAAGGVTVHGGTDVYVTLPATGEVRPGPAWREAMVRRGQGSGRCGTSGSGCQPALRLAPRLAPGDTARVRVDFDVDPTVHRLVLAFAVGADAD